MKNFSIRITLCLFLSALVSFAALAEANSSKSVRMLYLKPAIVEAGALEIKMVDYAKYLKNFLAMPKPADALTDETIQIWTALLSRCQDQNLEKCPLYTVRARASGTLLADTLVFMSRHQLLENKNSPKVVVPDIFILVSEFLSGEKQRLRIEFASWENKEKILVFDGTVLNKRPVENKKFDWIEDYAVMVLKPSQMDKVNSVGSSLFQGKEAAFFLKDFNNRDNHYFEMSLPDVEEAGETSDVTFYSDFIMGHTIFICGKDLPDMYCSPGISGGGYYDPDNRIAGIIVRGSTVTIEGTPTKVLFGIGLDVDKLISEIKNRVN